MSSGFYDVMISICDLLLFPLYTNKVFVMKYIVIYIFSGTDDTALGTRELSHTGVIFYLKL